MLRKSQQHIHYPVRRLAQDIDHFQYVLKIRVNNFSSFVIKVISSNKMNLDATSTNFAPPKDSLFRRSLQKNFIQEQPFITKRFNSPARRLQVSEKGHELLSTSSSFNPMATFTQLGNPRNKFTSQNPALQPQENLLSQTLYSMNKSNLSSKSTSHFKTIVSPSNQEKIKDLIPATLSTRHFQPTLEQSTAEKASTNRVFKAAFASILSRSSNKNDRSAPKELSKSEARENPSGAKIRKPPTPLLAEFSWKKGFNRSIDGDSVSMTKENFYSSPHDNKFQDFLSPSEAKRRNYKKFIDLPKNLQEISLVLKENRDGIKKYQEMIEKNISSMQQKRFSEHVMQRTMSNLKIRKIPNTHKKLIFDEPEQSSTRPREILLHHIIDTTQDHPVVTIVNQDSTERKNRSEQQPGQFSRENLLEKIAFKYTFFWYLRDMINGNWHPSAREGSTLISYKDKLYLYGGESISHEGGMFSLAIKEERWKNHDSDVNTPPFLRRGHTCVEKGGELFIFGGEILSGVDNRKRRCLSDLRCFDTRTQKWKTLLLNPKIPARRNHSACLMDDLLIIYGGVDDDGMYLSDVITINLSNLFFS